MSLLRELLGEWRLLNRICPCCSSSPPRPRCPVCHGSYDYGSHASGLGGPLSDQLRAHWRLRWEAADRPVRPPAHGFPETPWPTDAHTG